MSSTTHDDLMKYFRAHPFACGFHLTKDGKYNCYSSLKDILSRAQEYGAKKIELDKMSEWYTKYKNDQGCYEFTDRLKGIWKGSVDARHRHFGIDLREDNEYDKLVDNFENEVFRRMILAEHIPCCASGGLEFGALDNICKTILDFTKSMKQREMKVGNLYRDHNDMYWALHSLNLMGKRGDLDPDYIGIGECACFKIQKKIY